MTLRLRAPGSKSMTQRGLLLAALADAPTVLHGALRCDDSRHLGALLEALGCRLQWQGDTVEITPAPILRAPDHALDCGNAGTAVRFGACLSLLCRGALTLDGDEHMRSRPLGALVSALEELGVCAHYQGRAGCPPVRLELKGEPGARAHVDTSTSSQYASGLALVGPRLPRGLDIELNGAGVSGPYLDMTLAMMRQAGVVAQRQDSTLSIPVGRYRGGDIAIEPDWSAAAFLLAGGRLADIDVAVADLPAPDQSLQGDAAFASMLKALDVELDVQGRNHFDLSAAPDLIAPLAAVCLFAQHPSRIAGVAHARVKESDRIAVLARGLRQLGANVVEHSDGLTIAPMATVVRPATVPMPTVLDPDGDHRMAMAFGLVSLRLPAVEVADRGCVSKSFPDFWTMLEKLRGAGARPRDRSST